MPPSTAPAAPTAAPATTSAQALGNLQSFQGSMKSPEQFYNDAASSFGIPGQQQQVSGLRQAITNTTNLLNGVAPSVYGRTGSSLVTSAQAGRQIANEQAPINTQLKQQEGDLTNADSNLTRSLGEATTQADLSEKGQAGQLAALQAIYGNLSKQEQTALSNQLAQERLDLSRQSLSQGNSLSNLLQQALAGQNNNSGNTTSPPNYLNLIKSLPGVNLKGTGGAQGFNFTSGGKMVSAATYQKNNPNVGSIADLIHAMGQSGDAYANQAWNDIASNGGNVTPAIMNKYSALFWGEIPGPASNPYRSAGAGRATEFNRLLASNRGRR